MRKISTVKIMEIAEKVNQRIRDAALDSVTSAMNLTEEPDGARLRITANSYEILHIQQEFGDYCKVLAGCFADNRGIINACDCIRGVCGAAKIIVENKGLQLFCNIAEKPVFINADPLYLQQAVLALVLNSAEHAREGGRIDITVKKTARTAKIIVYDNGYGMDSETLMHCTEPLFSGGNTVNNKKPLGLGLALVSRFIKNSGGHMRIRSFYGKSTRVELNFPKAEAPEEADGINATSAQLFGYDDAEIKIALAPIL